MSARSRPLSDLLLAIAGPVIWAGHFFGLYLSEAVLCAAPGSLTEMLTRSIGVGLTIVALAMLAALTAMPAGRDSSRAHFAFARPLSMLSMLAVLWTFIPMTLLPACMPVGG